MSFRGLLFLLATQQKWYHNRPGKGYNFSHVLFDPRLSVRSQREVGKFSSVAIGMASATIATYMALRAGVIGQQRHSTSS